MNVKTFSDEWVEGFAKEAESRGLDQEEAKALLKYAAQQLLMEDKAFAEGFQETMEKSAFLPLILPALGTLGTLAGAYGLQQLYNRFRPSVGNTPEQADLIRKMHGSNDFEQMQELMNQYRHNQMTQAAQSQKSYTDFGKQLQGITGGKSNNRWWA